MISCRSFVAALIVCGIVWPLAALAGNAPTDDAGARMHSQAENQLLDVLDLAQHGNYDSAISDLSDLIAARPNFRLAQLVYGELMVARAGRSIDPPIGQKLRDARDALLDEAKTRWSHRMGTATNGKVPSVILQIAPETKHVIVVDLTDNRLYLFENNHGRPRLMSDFYATIGSGGPGKQLEGDMRTPVGIYHVTRYIPDPGLPELYGVGALPINYPNALDKRRGRTGYGIWLHGVPRTTYSRTPRSSEGCVVVANDDFESLYDNVDIGATPVILSADLRWVASSQIAEQRRALLSTIEDWRHSWQAIHTQAYLAYYAPDFVSDDGRHKQAFAAHKKEVNARKTDISVDLSQMSVFRYPGEKNMIEVSFAQRYESNNYSATDHKTQYWQQNDEGQWQIVLETESAAGD